MTRFAIKLHASTLVLEHEGQVAFGGVHVWRIAEASAESAAVTLAETRLEQELRACSEVRNPPEGSLGVVFEECRRLTWLSRRRGTALVFYVDTDSPKNAHLVSSPN